MYIYSTFGGNIWNMNTNKGSTFNGALPQQISGRGQTHSDYTRASEKRGSGKTAPSNFVSYVRSRALSGSQRVMRNLNAKRGVRNFNRPINIQNTGLKFLIPHLIFKSLIPRLGP